MPSRSLSIAVIGAGPVGTALAVHCRSLGHRIVAVISRNPASARRLARRVDCRLSSDRLRQLSLLETDRSIDLVLVAVPDRVLRAVGASLAAAVSWGPRTSFIHTSGALTTECFAALKAKGHRVASLHPIQSFPRLGRRMDPFVEVAGIWWGVECATADRRWAFHLVRTWRGRPVRVPKETKIAYHLACTLAANYPVVLWSLTEKIGRIAGIPRGMEPFAPLIRSTLENTISMGPRKALTGPAVRGDHDVLRAHREFLRGAAPRWVGLFDALVLRAGSPANKHRTKRKT